MSRFWDNPDRIDKLRELFNKGWSAGQISLHFREAVSRSAVIGKLHRLGLQRGGLQPRIRKAKGAKPKEKPKKPPRLNFGKPKLSEILKPEPLPEEPADDIALTTVVDRERHQCCWIVGEPKAMRMCGLPVVPGIAPAWCLKHARRGFALPDLKRESPVLQAENELEAA